MRVTFQSQSRDGIAGIQAAAEQLLDAQRKVSSGRRLNAISDNPGDAAAIVAERNSLSGIEQYQRASDSVGSRLQVVDTVLSDIVDKLSQAQSAALNGQGSNKTQIQRNAAAGTLVGLRAALLDDLNTTFHGTYVFSGASVTTQPFTTGAGGAVNAYAGSTVENSVDVGDGRSVKVSYDGSVIAQGSAPQHIFDVLDQLIADMQAGNDAGISTGIAALKDAFTRAQTAQSRLGNDINENDTQKMRLQQMKLSTDERLSKLEEADMSEALTNMSNADTAYKAALGAVGTITRTSLLDYLK